MSQCIRLEGSIHFQTQGSNGLPEESVFLSGFFRCNYASGIVMRKRQQSERPGVFLWLCFLPSFSGCEGKRS